MTATITRRALLAATAALGLLSAGAATAQDKVPLRMSTVA